MLNLFSRSKIISSLLLAFFAGTIVEAKARDISTYNIPNDTTQTSPKDIRATINAGPKSPDQTIEVNHNVILSQSLPANTSNLFESNLEEAYGPEFFGVDTSCALSLAIGCRKGFYFSTSYVGTDSNILPILSGSYENTETTILYRSNVSEDDALLGRDIEISILTDLEISERTEPNFGGNIVIGYDHGGFRTELMGSISSFTKTLSVTGGLNAFTFDRAFFAGGEEILSAGTFVEIGGPLPDDITFDIDTYTFMLRGFVDIPTGFPITPFFGVGLGAKAIYVGSDSSEGYDICTTVDPSLYNPCPAKFEVEGGSTIVFTGQAIAGLSFQLTEKVSLNSELTYDYTSGGTAGDYDFTDNGNFTGSFGVRYKF